MFQRRIPQEEVAHGVNRVRWGEDTLALRSAPIGNNRNGQQSLGLAVISDVLLGSLSARTQSQFLRQSRRHFPVVLRVHDEVPRTVTCADRFGSEVVSHRDHAPWLAFWKLQGPW
jgi:hypothetical protein